MSITSEEVRAVPLRLSHQPHPPGPVPHRPMASPSTGTPRRRALCSEAHPWHCLRWRRRGSHPLEDVVVEDGPVVANKVQIVQQIIHNGGVNRARYMPQNNSIIATKTSTGKAFVFDCSKHPLNPPLDGRFKPDLRLRGQYFEGVGISWSPFVEGYLLSGADHGLICLWDTEGTPENKLLGPLQLFQGHDGVVEDVAWHLRHWYMFGSVGEDHHLQLWDLRIALANKPIHSVVAHAQAVNCLAFNTFNERILATGSDDGTLKLFDIRKIHAAVHTFHANAEEIYQVEWSPKNEGVLASSCFAGGLLVWDVRRIGDEQSSDDTRGHPPELLFDHAGHMERILDFSWNPCDDWAIASVSSNVFQMWRMAKHIYKGDA